MCLIAVCVFLSISIVAVSQPLKIKLQMDELTNITEPQNIIDVTLKPQQGFVYHTDFLQPLSYYSQNCRSIRGELAEQVLSTFPDIKSNIQSQHVYSEKYGMIYRLENQNLIAYTFSNLTHQLDNISKLDFKNSNCQAYIILSENQQFLYHFSCDKVTKIDMKKSFTGISNAYLNQELFYGFKVVRGHGFFVWVSFSEGIKIYAINKQDNLELTQTIQKFQQKLIDAILHQNRLYILGLQKNIYILEHLGTGKFKELKNISIESICPECRNRQIVAYKQNIFVYSKVNGEQFIAQLQNSKDFESVSLVRYYKGRKNFVTMNILNGRLLTVYKLFINLYEINKDPRTIKRLDNGISNTHFDRILKLQRVSDHLFIKQSQTSTSIIKISIKTPFIECNYKEEQEKIEQITVTQPCRLEENKIYHESKYSISCTSIDKINIKVQMQKGGYHHIVAVVSVFVFCALVVLFLILWRKYKMQLIENIVKEIQKFKNMRKRKEEIQFVEEKVPTRQSNWDQIHQIEEQSKQKQKSQTKEQEHKQYSGNKKQDHHEELNEEVEEQIQEELDENVQGTQRNMITGGN